MTEEYLTENVYVHPLARLNCTSGGSPHSSNLYGFASFLLTCGYCAHQDTKDNGAAPRARIQGILKDWLTEDKERNLYLRHSGTLEATAEELAERLFNTID